MSNTTTLLWTSADPRQSKLFTSWGTFYRFDTDSSTGKTITTLYRAIKPGKEDRIARLEWGANGALGRALIGRNTMSMADLIMQDGHPLTRAFNGPDGYRYWWRPSPYSADLELLDINQNVIAFFRPLAPVRYDHGVAYGELCFLPNSGTGTVVHPPLMDMVCITAMLYRLVNISIQ